MSAFDIFENELAGTHLIDASAGTGKTYTISAVYLRLLLERELAVKQILVVTYTEAATHDLRRRIREKIIDAFNAFSTGKAEEEILQKLLARFSDHHGRAVKLLGDALRSFDEASVYTIHGFCQRMLKENSLENGILFNSELVTDQDEYIVEVAEDFFRHHFYLASREFVEKAGPLLQPAATAPFLKKWLPHVGMRLLTAEDVPDDKTVADLEGRLRDVYYRAAQLWHGDGECIRELLLGCKGLNRNKYRLTSLPGWFVSMDKLFAGKEATVALFDRFNRFTTVELNNCVKKGGQAPEHHFFDSCQELAEAAADLAEVYRKKITILKARLLSDGNREIQARKEAHNVLAFDDLLRKLHGGLQGRQGKQLAESIRLRFPAAMIDEFQDTDPIQYEIFTSIYLGGRGMLYLIGDPKQAIYSFRGADIFAYIRAIRNIESRRTLMYNWRSEPGLIEAVNTLFGNRKNPFIFKEITFAPVLAAEKEQTRFSARGESDKPFHIVMLDREKEDNAALKQMAKQTAGERILESMADEIVKLLNLGADNRAHIADRTLQPGDLAVLVRTNDQARRVWRTLRKRRVPCVLQSTENLFGSHEAGELAIVLQALADPSDPRLVKGALVTDMFGLSAYDLVRVEEETELDRWLEKFREYSIMWHEKGFFRMMRRLTEKEGIRSRLLGYSDGERRAVNYLHLLEILHKTEQEKHLGPAGMIIFLRQRVYAAREESVEEYELRLESDADRVQIVTIHKSKGLQYPVVFCPFLWEGVGMTANRGEKTCAFHARDETLALTLDLGSDHLDENREKSLQEELAENLRIAYVALTRAAQRCYVYWGAFKTAGASGFARLVHGHRDDEQKGGQKPGLESFAHLSDPEIMEDLERLAQAAGNEIIVNAPGLPNYSEFMIDRGAGKELSCRQFSGVIDSAWRVSSFSALTASIEKQNRESGRGERERREPEEKRSIFTFPKGAGAGTFMHAIFEDMDFTWPEDKRIALIQKKLHLYGYDENWAGVIGRMVGGILNANLPGLDDDFCLSRLTTKERINEMEFYLLQQKCDSRSFSDLFLKAGKPCLQRTGEQLGRLSFGKISGMMKGFVDLVFHWRGKYYIIDWKSNYLGDTSSDYREENLTDVMVRENYILQYFIYTVAVDQYLRTRVPGYSYQEHFGGVYYLFLRGITAKGDEGIFHDLPDQDILKRFGRFFGSPPAESSGLN